MTTTVVIADRSPFVRMAARSALTEQGIAVVAEADTAASALRASVEHRPDAVLFDAELDEDLTSLGSLRDQLPGTAMIVLSPDESVYRAVAAVRAGACGFVPKDTPPDRLPDIVRGAVAGESAIPRRVVRRMLERMAAAGAADLVPRAPVEPLSARECEVLERLSKGMTDRLIGADLGVSEVTVRRHAAAAARKLGANRREEAVATFRRLSLELGATC